MRVAHITDCYAPRTGGIESQVQDLAELQREAGHEVRVITATPAQRPDRGGVPITRITMPLPYQLPVHPFAFRSISADLRRRPVDVLHIHVGAASPFAWGGVRAARHMSVPTVVTVHSMWDSVSSFGYRTLGHSPWRFTADMVVTSVGSHAARLVAAALPDHPQVGVLPNGIDPRSWVVARTPRPESSIRVVSVLRMAPRKRAVPLTRALLEAVRRSQGAITATLIGDGPDRRRVQSVIEKAGLGSFITLTGHVSRGEVRSHFAHADVFCQASVRESFGIAALEARTSGLAVIARRGSGTSDFIHDGVDGRLVASDRGITEALLDFLRVPAMLDGMVEHNTSVSPEQTWPRVLATAEACYAQALAK